SSSAVHGRVGLLGVGAWLVMVSPSDLAGDQEQGAFLGRVAGADRGEAGDPGVAVLRRRQVDPHRDRTRLRLPGPARWADGDPGQGAALLEDPRVVPGVAVPGPRVAGVWPVRGRGELVRLPGHPRRRPGRAQRGHEALLEV